MLARAAEKLKAGAFPAGVTAPVFLQGDLRSLDLGQRFDVVLMMFAVLGYQHENADLLAALGTVRRHLEPGGLFLFDVWNGLAVLADRPGRRVREVSIGTTRFVRTSDADLDLVRHRCRVRFRVQRIDISGDCEEFDEEHVVRFFFPQELDLALRCCALRLVNLRGFPDYERQPDERAWNVIGVGRAE
jgi:SAM-dependent methyltransferase